MIKKIISTTLILWIFSSIFPFQTQAWTNCKAQKFLVSAYYSPLPGQNKYIRWTYEWDIRLNWRWTNWADWTEVYMWLLAAPRTYKFWTKINLPGLWLWTVHDRGWAIIAKSNYDRIDIWMWKWEAGLSRALNWGMRFIDWEICEAWADNLDFTSVPSKLPWYVERRLVSRTTSLKNWWTYTFVWSWVWWKKVTVWWKTSWASVSAKKIVVKKEEEFEFVKIPKDIWEGDSWENVLKLQMILQNIWFYRDSTITWKYDIETMEAVFNFQRENWVVDSLDQLWAGHFWKRTKAALEKYLKELHSEIKFVSGVKKWEIIKWVDVEKIVKKDLKIEDAIWLNRLEKKQDIVTLSDSLTVLDIQNILKNWKKINPQDPWLILTLIPWKIVNKVKFMP